VRSLLSVVIAGVLAAACSTASEPPAATPRSNEVVDGCVPNRTFVCLCGIEEGTQTCTESGTLTPCVCPKDEPAPPPAPAPPPKPVSQCGDGVVDVGEACDDGNKTNGDGCNDRCGPDGAPAESEKCPGQPLTLWKGKEIVLTGTTTGARDNHVSTCFDADGPDRVFAIKPSADGFMKIHGSFETGFNAVVSVRKDTCGYVTGEVLCKDTLSQPFENVLQVEAKSTYYLFVDGDLVGESGAYVVRVELP
jgi:cysteine-rich repeat protein